MPIFGPLFFALLVAPVALAQSTPATTDPVAPAPRGATPASQSTSQSVPAAPTPPQVTAINVKNIGIFTAQEQPVQKPATESIPFAGVSNVRLAKKTRTVPIAEGVNFGFQYLVVGKPRGEKATLHFVVIYPPPGLGKPGSSNPIPRDEYDQKVRIGVKGNYNGYELDNDWEMLPGDWTLEIWSGSNKLASETFTLVKK